MRRSHGASQDTPLNLEPCESRDLLTLVFVLSGNALRATGPGPLTAEAAQILRSAGDQAIQLSTPTINTPAAFKSVVHHIESLSHGQPIGIVGFSSGGTLAVRLAGVKELHVKAVLDNYGPPDARAYFAYHQNDRFSQYVRGHARLTPAVINMLSGPIDTATYVDAAFGLYDQNAVAAMSAASFQKDVPHGQVFYYPGPHGAAVTASPPALEDFLAHL